MAEGIKSVFTRIKRFFQKNWLTLVLTFICAIVMWGLVLKDENPERIKYIRDVPVTLEGEADLLSRHFVVMGDRSEVLPNVVVGVNIDLLRYSDLSEKDVTAVVSLRKINGEGEYEITISASTNKGTVVSVSPKSVKINVDRFNTKKIPVEVTTENKLAKGLISGEITASKKEIEIEGANSVISKVVKAVYCIDFSEVKESLNESVSLTLIDEDNNPVPQSEIYGELPSIGIKMPVYYYKEVSFDIENNILNSDLINENFEIVSMYTDPAKVNILSDDLTKIERLKTLDIEKIDVAYLNTDVERDVQFTLPDGTWLEKELNTVRVHIVIREKQVEKEFKDIKINIIGASGALTYKFSIKTADVTIKCPISLASKINKFDIVLSINVGELEKGKSGEIPIAYRFTNGIDESSVAVTLSSENVNVSVE